MTDRPWGDYQYEIYLAGLGGQKPALPVPLAELEARAYEAMTEESRGYVSGGAGSGDTMRANLEAFRRWRIVPRMLRDISSRDLSVKLFGKTFETPVLLAPIGVQSIVHDEGEVAVARAGAELEVPVVLSTAASHSIEEVAEASGDNVRWYQLYRPNDDELAASFLKRAEAAGYEAIVVTLDTALLAWRPLDLQHAFLPFLRGEGIANYLSDPVFRGRLDKPPEEDLESAVFQWAQVFSDPGATWDKLSFVKEHTSLPVLLKGILDPADAARAIELGMDGVIVSNHGGRQVDGAIGALDALPAVVDAVPEDFPVLFDSGIRSGADAFKALALGARAILLGRPYVWGLALGGADGIKQVLRAFLAELDLTVALAGHASLDTVDRSTLYRAGA